VGNHLHPDQCANCHGFPIRGLAEWKKSHPSSQRRLCKGRMSCRYKAVDLLPRKHVVAARAKEFRQRVYASVHNRFLDYVQHAQLNRETAYALRQDVTNAVREVAIAAGYSYETADVVTEMILGQTALDTSGGRILFTDLEDGHDTQNQDG
jgi:hypothetical protein